MLFKYKISLGMSTSILFARSTTSVTRWLPVQQEDQFLFPI
jgi:hypothetical protein